MTLFGKFRPWPSKAGRRLTVGMSVRERVARLALLWEAVWRAAWLPLSIIGAFAVLALFDVLPALGAWIHTLVVLVTAAALVVAVWRGVKTLSLPTAKQARRRLEVDNALEHRPLTLLQDQLAAGQGEPAAEALWEAHRARAREALAGLRVGTPRPGLSRIDPYGVRFAVLLLLVVAVAAGYGDMPDRLRRAVSPDLETVAGLTPPRAELWITPPEYTGYAPTFLRLGETTEDANGMVIDADNPLIIPTGSEISVLVHNGRGTPEIAIATERWALQSQDDSSWALETKLAIPSDVISPMGLQTAIQVHQGGRDLGEWPALIVGDFAPRVTLTEPPGATRGSTLGIHYQALDDYGLERVTAEIRRIDKPHQSFELQLSLPRYDDGETVSSFHDLTAHPWAGLPVDIRVEAHDALDQSSSTAYAATLLPERDFNHPVAREIIALRKVLTRDPSQQLNVAHELDQLKERRDAYGDDTVAYLALTAAEARLTYNPPPTIRWMTYSLDGPESTRQELAIASAQALMWDVALRIEDGGLSLAERELRELQERLQQALSEDANDPEVQALMDQLREALDRFFAAAAENLRQALERGELPMQLDPEALAMSQQELQEMIERARELAEMGARESAQAMLEQLQRMLDGLRMGQQFAQPQDGQNMAQELMQDLQSIIRGQQQLLDETFQRRQQDGADNSQGDQQGDQQGDRQGDENGTANREGAERQEGLRRRFGEFMHEFGSLLGQIPEEFGDAEGEMRGSREALEEGELDDSVEAQQRALQALQQGGQNAAQALAEAAQGQGQGLGEFALGLLPGEMVPQGMDPFGRPLDGNRGFATGDVEVPSDSDVQRARKILEELRDRAGDRDRPADELDYIHRLLRRF